MSQTIEGVPESITREQYLGLMSAAGFTPKDIFVLEFRADGIYAETPVRDAEGHLVIDRTADDCAARHRVFIPVIDDAEAAA